MELSCDASKSSHCAKFVLRLNSKVHKIVYEGFYFQDLRLKLRLDQHILINQFASHSVKSRQNL